MNYTDLEQKLLETGLVHKSSYLTKYCELLLTNSLVEYDSSKANYHHAIPRIYFEDNNLAVDNSNDNLFILLYKDHVLAHYYLAMAAVDDTFKYKMAYAVRFVVGQIKDITERDLLAKLPEAQKSYELIAHGFSINNPSKKPENAKKISEARKGKIYIRKDNKSIIIKPDQLDEYIAQGWERGRVGNWTHSQKNKIGIVYEGKNKLITRAELQHYLDLGATIGHLPHHITNKGNMGKMSAESRTRQAENRRNKIAIHNKLTGKVMYIIKEDLDSYLQQGYELGSGRAVKSCLGKICIHKGTTIKYILPEELENYLKLGFTKGKYDKEVI